MMLTLFASGWNDEKSQTLLVDGLGANQNGSISVGSTATVTQREAARNAVLCITAQVDGALTITADGDVPNIDIPVLLILFEKEA